MIWFFESSRSYTLSELPNAMIASFDSRAGGGGEGGVVEGSEPGGGGGGGNDFAWVKERSNPVWARDWRRIS
jgi:hypothetical protein